MIQFEKQLLGAEVWVLNRSLLNPKIMLDVEFEVWQAGFADCENPEVEQEYLAKGTRERWIANQAAERKHTPLFDCLRNAPGVSVAARGG